jgi:hypothetical protein
MIPESSANREVRDLSGRSVPEQMGQGGDAPA